VSSHRRRLVLLRWSAVAAALALPAALALGGPPASAGPAEPSYTLVSHPDFLNADIGDATLSPLWQPGDPNSINDSYRAGLDTVLGAIDGEHPDSLLVAGDLVEGHWGQDVDRTGIFGPVDTDEQKREAITRAGDLYYSQWWQRLAARGIKTHAAVGDHDIGDNPWKGSASADFKRSALPTYAAVWSKYATTRNGVPRYASHPRSGVHTTTAYSTRLAPDILLVTVDVFQPTATDVRPTVTGAQLSWLDRVLSRADTEHVGWVIVQGHVPVLWPVRSRSSSRLHMDGGAGSAFWRVLVKHKVDLYLCGEVHDTTAVERDGVMQVCHGGLFVKGQSSYMVGSFTPTQAHLTVKDVVSGPAQQQPPLWATTLKRPPAAVNYLGGTRVMGEMTLTSSNQVLRRTGKLAPWKLLVSLAGPNSERALTGQGTWSATADDPRAVFEFETRSGSGSTALGAAARAGWRTSGTLTEPLPDGTSTCARARAKVNVTELVSAWSGWRCVTAPYDDAALSRTSGRVRRLHDDLAYHATTSTLGSVGTSVDGPTVDASVGRLAVGARVGPGGGTVSVSIGDSPIGSVSLEAAQPGLAWLALDPGGRQGPLRLTKTQAGPVVLDGVEVSHLL